MWAGIWEWRAHRRPAETQDIQRHLAHHTAFGQGVSSLSQYRPPAHLEATQPAGPHRDSPAAALHHRGSVQVVHGCSNRQLAVQHQLFCLGARWFPAVWVPTWPKCNCSIPCRDQQVCQVRRIYLMRRACSDRTGPAWPVAHQAATPRHPQLLPQSQ